MKMDARIKTTNTFTSNVDMMCIRKFIHVQGFYLAKKFLILVFSEFSD